MGAIHHHTNWKEEAITRAEGITDAWEIAKVYAGRLAEWILFLCMIANIIEILPGVQLWGWFINGVLGFQAVTLDVAGFGLATMAEQARLVGKDEVARRAKQTAYVLIGLMMVTVLCISIGTLWPQVKGTTDFADKILILIRVGMTVWYGHVLHDLRQHTGNVLPTSVIEERLSQLTERVSQLRQEPINYEKLAAQMVPLLPQPETMNYERLAFQMVPLLPVPSSPNDERLVEQIVAQVVAQITALHEKERAFHVAQDMPRALPGPFHLKAVKGQTKRENTEGEQRQLFVRDYLSEYPDASISTIVKAAQMKGITLSTGYVSQQRKILKCDAS